MKKQGRPFMPPEERRKSINIKVAPATAAWLKAQDCSQGMAVDHAVMVHQEVLAGMWVRHDN